MAAPDLSSGFCAEEMHSSPQLRIQISSHVGRAHISLAGEIDIATLPALRECLDVAHRQGHYSIELDLEQVQFMCAGALSVLANTQATLAWAGGKLILVEPSLSVRRVLAICDVDSQLNVR